MYSFSLINALAPQFLQLSAFSGTFSAFQCNKTALFQHIPSIFAVNNFDFRLRIIQFECKLTSIEYSIKYSRFVKKSNRFDARQK